MFDLRASGIVVAILAAVPAASFASSFRGLGTLEGEPPYSYPRDVSADGSVVVGKSRSAKDLSLGMFSLFCLGVAMWLAYGLLVRDIPVIAANVLTLMLASTLLFFKLRFKQ